MQTTINKAVQSLPPAYGVFIDEMEKAIPGFWADVLKGTIDDFTNPMMGEFSGYTIECFSWDSEAKKAKAWRLALKALAHFEEAKAQHSVTQ